MELMLTRTVNPDTVGLTRVAMNNGIWSKFVRRAVRRVVGDVPNAVDLMNEASRRYAEARGDDSAPANPFDAVNSVLSENGYPEFPYQERGGRRRYSYEDSNGNPSPGRQAFQAFLHTHTRQREIGELIFYNAIQRYNDTVSVADGGEPILLSEARRAHDEWLRNFSLSESSHPLNEINEVLSRRFGMGPVPMTEARRISGVYDRMTGVGDDLVVRGLYPVSPYDDRFRDFVSSGERGTRLGIIDVASSGEPGDDPISVDDLSLGAVHPTVRNLMLIYDRRQTSVDAFLPRLANGDINFGGSYRQTAFATDADIARLGRLRGYMRPEEYASMVAHVSESWSRLLDDDFDWTSLGAAAEYSDRLDMAGSGSQEDARAAFMANVDKCVGRVASICQALIDNGYDYEVRAAREPGQVELAVEGTGVTVRIMDRPEEIYYIGRVNDTDSLTQSYVSVDVDRTDRSYDSGISMEESVRREVESRIESELGVTMTSLPAGRRQSVVSNMHREVAGRLKGMSAVMSIAMNFDVDDSVFVDNVLYALGHDVVLEDGHRLGEGDRFEKGDSTKSDSAEHMSVSGHDVSSVVGGHRVNGHVSIVTRTDSGYQPSIERYDNDATYAGAKAAIASMVTSARREFENEVNLVELADIARREARAAFDRDDGVRPDEMPVPSDVAFGERAVLDPGVSSLREDYWRLMTGMEYDALVAGRDGVEVPAPKFVLANMDFDRERIYDSLTGTLVLSDTLDRMVISEGDQDADGTNVRDVLYPDSVSGNGDILHARGFEAASEHLADLMDAYFGSVMSIDGDVAHRVNYFDLSGIDRSRFGGIRAYARVSEDGFAVGRDSEDVVSANGGSYVRRGIDEFGELDVSGTAFEGSDLLTHETLGSDVVSVDFAHVLAFQPNGSYVNNRQAMLSSYMRVLDDERESGESVVVVANPEEVGTTRFLDSTLRFGDNDATVVSLHDLREAASSGSEMSAADAFRLRILDRVERTLLGTRCKVSDEDIRIDSNGVVQYDAVRVRNGRRRRDGSFSEDDSHTITGTIGQVFVPDEHGLFDCDFLSSEGYLLAGGYFVHALNQISNDGNYLDRMRAMSFADLVEREVASVVRGQIVGARAKRLDRVGQSTMLNPRWRDDVVGTRFSHDEFESNEVVDDETRDRRVRAAQMKCRLVGFDAEKETSILASEQNRRRSVHDIADDIEHGGRGLTGNAETTHITEAESGIFDMRMLPNGKNVAFTRYLTSDATVEADGSITPGETMGRNVLTEHSSMRYSDYDAHNRIIMGQSNVMHAEHVDEAPSAFAQVTIGGFSKDDALVISKQYAEEHHLHGKNGVVRGLEICDKMGETHGNKGLVGLIVDPDMNVDELIAARVELWESRVSDAVAETERCREELDDFKRSHDGERLTDEEDAERLELKRALRRAERRETSTRKMAGDQILHAQADRGMMEDIVKLFAKNRGDDGRPRLDVAYSPFSPCSRRNMGLAREAISNESYPLVMPDDSVVEGGIGLARFVTHDKAVDKKTSTENGRTSGYQLSHMLQSAGCEKALTDIFGSNERAFVTEREAARAAYGFDILDDGTVSDKIEYPDRDDESVYRLDEGLERTDNGYISDESIAKFSSWMMVRGGYMEVPFELSWPDTVVKAPSDPEAGEDGRLTVAGNVAHAVDGASEGSERYLIPVMAASERRGKTSTEGGYRLHDHTGSYVGIYSQAIRYLKAQESLSEVHEKMSALSADGKEGTPDWDRFAERESRLERTMERAKTSAQSTFSSLCCAVRERAFESNDNYAKTKFMGVKLPGNYATAPWVGDPRLDIDCAGIGESLANKMQIKEGDVVLMWRPPCNTKATSLAVKVHIDPDIQGVRVNPELAALMSGDFDGDTVGFGQPYDRAALAEMADRCSVARELVNRRCAGHPMVMGRDADLAYAAYLNPELKERLDSIEARAQAVFDRHQAAGTLISGSVPAPDGNGTVTYVQEMTPLLHELSDTVHDGFSSVVGKGALSFKDAASYLQSVLDVNVTPGVKGSVGVVEVLAKNLGVSGVSIHEEDGRFVLDADKLVDVGHTLQTYEDYQSTMDASALKSYATGEVGKFQQMFFAAFPGEVEMCNALSEPLYQMPLDWKHVGAVARRQHEIIPVIKGLFEGYKYDVTPDASASGGVAFKACGTYDDSGRFIPLQDDNLDHWRDTVRRAYQAVEKDNFDPAYLDRLAEGLWESFDSGLGRVRGLSERAAEVSSPLLRMAFTDGADAFVMAARHGDNLFMTHTGDEAVDRYVSQTFMPLPVREALGFVEVPSTGDADGKPAEREVAPKVDGVSAEGEQFVESVASSMPQRPSADEIREAANEATSKFSGVMREPADDSGISAEKESSYEASHEDREV